MKREKGTHRQLHLHVGAHKTATTRLQSLMVRNARELRRRGVAVFCPPDERLFIDTARAPETDIATIFPPQLLHQKERSARIAATLRRLSNMWKLRRYAADLVVVSEENLISEAAGYPLIGPLYPRAEENLLLLRRALPVEPRRVFLGVRDYAFFFESLYAEGARWFLLPREEAVRASVLRQVIELGAGWHSFAKTLTRIFPEAVIEVWRYEAFDERRRLSALLDGREEGLDLTPGGDNSRIPCSAISRLQIARARGEAAPAEIAAAEPDERLQLFDAEDRVALARAYKRDLERMREAGACVVDY